jgi:L-alanine-DL-glutamate epimerase-like enolase superfamily enzyme
MKIVGISTVPYEYELTRSIGDVNLPGGVRHSADLAVFVETDEEGLTGTTIGAFEAAEAIRRLEPLLVGEDPRAVTALWERMLAVAFKAGLAGPIRLAVAAIDCALWDVRAKAHGIPLWKELGGSTSTVPAYASGLDTPLSDSELVDYYRRMAELGVSTGKLKIGRDRDDDLRRLGLMADALGSRGTRPSVMVDANEFWTPKQAIQRLTEIERSFELVWAEEPVRRWDVSGLRRVSDAIRAPVATGENLNAVNEYVPLIAAGAVDVVQFGARTGGITGSLHIAELAYAFDLPVSLMNCPGRFAAHLAAALPHHTRMEVLDAGRDAALVDQPPVRDGLIRLGDEPGAGVVFDPDRLAAHRIETPRGPNLASTYRRAPDAGLVG